MSLEKLGLKREAKSIKPVVADLQETHPGLIDPALVSSYLRNV
uniref:Uncharacterized protein n=1 Tax=Caulobacter phage BL57 TaxID=3348355 RepID=A0AB74UML3_9VIRU